MVSVCHLFFRFSFLTFLSLCSLSKLSSSLYLLLSFSIFLPLFPSLPSRSLPITVSVFLASTSFHFLDFCAFCHFSHPILSMYPAISIYFSPSFFVKLSFAPTSTFILHSSLISSLKTHDFSYPAVFANLHLLLLYLLVPLSPGHTYMCAWVAHEQSTLSLGIRDMHL